MTHTLQLDINNHRYQLVNSMADGMYLVEINPQRRLYILLGVLFILLTGYFYSFFPASGQFFKVSSASRVEPVVLEKHLSIDESLSVESHQHPVYLYYDNFNILETFLPGHDNKL